MGCSVSEDTLPYRLEEGISTGVLDRWHNCLLIYWCNVAQLPRHIWCTAYSPGKDFELILMVKMETRHPIERPFGCELPAICNHCRVYDGLKSQDVEILWAIFALFKWSLASWCYCTDCAQNLPGPATHIWLTLFQLSSKLVQFQLSYCWTREDRFAPYSVCNIGSSKPIIRIIF